MHSNQTYEYSHLINKHYYDYFFSISFNDACNYNEDKQIKLFLKYLHQKLFSKRFHKYDKFLRIVLVQEKTIDANAHYHGIIKTEPHKFSYERLIQAFAYASKKTNSTRSIKYKDIPILTFNHYKQKHKNEILSKLHKFNNKDNKFPLNLTLIDSYDDQQNIVKYILKQCHKNNYPVAFLEPIRNLYFNFSTYQKT